LAGGRPSEYHWINLKVQTHTRVQVRNAGADAGPDGEADRPRDRRRPEEDGLQRRPPRPRRPRRRRQRYGGRGTGADVRTGAADRHQRPEESRRDGESHFFDSCRNNDVSVKQYSVTRYICLGDAVANAAAVSDRFINADSEIPRWGGDPITS
jgi:hypothetical protein